MKSLKFKKIDAFVGENSTGNPAAAIYLDDPEELSEQTMLAIAAQLKCLVSEVGFVAPLSSGVFDIRFFTSEKEVAFCGHASIAICYDLIKKDPKLLKKKVIKVVTRKGQLGVLNEIPERDAVFISAPAPVFRKFDLQLEEAAAALGIDADRIDRDIPVGIVNAGSTTLCLPLKSLEDVIHARPDFGAQKSYCESNDLDIINIFSRQVSLSTSYLRTRVFAAPFGYLEDPATGSGNAALLYHLRKTGYWSGHAVAIEQGIDKAYPNIIEIAPCEDQGSTVMFGGSAKVRISGRYYL